MSVGALPPVVFRLAGHPLRWRLLSELAYSDRRVGELMASLRRPQSLVSYHLRQLRTAGLVSARRSSFDARDSYYTLDLARCGELLADGNGLASPRADAPPNALTEPKPARRRATLVFLCTGNSTRSQIAEALLPRGSRGTTVEVFGAELATPRRCTRTPCTCSARAR